MFPSPVGAAPVRRAARLAGGTGHCAGPIEWTATSSPSANHAHSFREHSEFRPTLQTPNAATSVHIGETRHARVRPVGSQQGVVRRFSKFLVANRGEIAQGVPRGVRTGDRLGGGLPVRGSQFHSPAEVRRGLSDRRARPPGARLPGRAPRSSERPRRSALPGLAHVVRAERVLHTLQPPDRRVLTSGNCSAPGSAGRCPVDTQTLQRFRERVLVGLIPHDEVRETNNAHGNDHDKSTSALPGTRGRRPVPPFDGLEVNVRIRAPGPLHFPSGTGINAKSDPGSIL